jgi:hypothetical protein
MPYWRRNAPSASGVSPRRATPRSARVSAGVKTIIISLAKGSPQMNMNHMRPFLPAALAITTVAAAMIVETPDANAVVYCVAGAYRAGCVARPAYVGGVRGVARRTTRRVIRRSDMMLKHDISLLGHLDNGLGFYRFSYHGSDKAYVGVMAQEVQTVVREAVVRGRDGYLQVSYDRLGLQFQTYDQWVASGAHVPAGASVEH